MNVYVCLVVFPCRPRIRGVPLVSQGAETYGLSGVEDGPLAPTSMFTNQGVHVISKKFVLQPLAAALLVFAAGASHAVITVYTSQAAFTAATSAPGVDTYTGFSITSTTPSPITRSAGAYTYRALAFDPAFPTTPTSFFGAGTTANPWLSTNTATDSIQFDTFTGSPKAIGGNFFDSDVNGAFAAGSITLVATDSFGATSTQTITGATVTSFLGFVSNGTVTKLVVSAVQPAAGFVWPTVDNLTLAVAVVPEPGTYGMMLAGLGLVGFLARRRRG